MRGARFSARRSMRVPILWASTAAFVVVLGGCSTDAADPVQPAATGLAEPAAGRLVRILGDGTWDLLDRAGPAATSSVNRPGGLVALPDGTLLGIQGTASFPGLFTMTPAGEAAPVATAASGQPGLRQGYPVAATVAGSRYLVALASGELEVVDRATGALIGSTALPARDPAGWAAAFLRLDGRTVLQYGDRWLALTGAAGGRPRLTAVEATDRGVLASAPSGTGSLLLLSDRLVRLNRAGAPVGTADVTMPEQVQGMTVTAAVADGNGGLVVALATRSGTSFGDSGALVRVQADGTATLLASGTKPGKGLDCDDANTPAEDAHLAQPLSVVVWQQRIVVADTACNSLLSLPLVAG